MQQSNLEQRNTKQIIEEFVINANNWTSFRGKRFFYNQAMFFGVSPIGSSNICYEVKITRKKQRISNCNNKKNIDKTKNIFLLDFLRILSFLFGERKIQIHDGKLVLHDELNDYTIELVRKAGLEWKE